MAPHVKKITINTLRQAKGLRKFSCLTAYDATFGHWVSESDVDVILVGDSLGMVLQGHDSTVPVTVADLAYHTRSVAAGNQNCLLMSDVPFMQAASVDRALNAAEQLMRAGAEIVKIEGDERMEPVIRALNAAGVPVCVHLGLTPQFVHRFGGYRVQGRDQETFDATVAAAQMLEQAGADMVLLECVPSPLGAAVTSAVAVPVIGIGAGADTDGQVLVMHDMLGFNPHRLARFVKSYPDRHPLEAFNDFAQDVQSGAFPAAEHQFSE